MVCNQDIRKPSKHQKSKTHVRVISSLEFASGPDTKTRKCVLGLDYLFAKINIMFLAWLTAFEYFRFSPCISSEQAAAFSLESFRSFRIPNFNIQKSYSHIIYQSCPIRSHQMTVKLNWTSSAGIRTDFIGARVGEISFSRPPVRKKNPITFFFRPCSSFSSLFAFRFPPSRRWRPRLGGNDIETSSQSSSERQIGGTFREPLWYIRGKS